MARFYIPTQPDCTTDRVYFHPAVRKDTVLDLSVKKLYALKQEQRATHRPADLLKTVLVYNMFKAAVSAPSASNGGGAGVGASAMDVDENRAAEQSWFDQCIDDMDDSDSELLLSDDDDDDDEVEEEVEVEQSNPTVVTSTMTVFEGEDGCMLKRSPQAASVRSLCALGRDGAMDCQMGEEGGRWQGPGFAHGKYADLFAANSVSLGAPAPCIY
ncbi:hypothetical protein GGF43_001267 [Coemansia sp. RSA 2618]|nr:hypothetical protein GGF43_001267 [Coemansia sp. RSA 2618]